MRSALKIRLEKIEEEARKTFGDEHSQRWLRSPSRYFEGKSPLEFAKQAETGGADKVLTHIGYFNEARF